MGQNTGKYDGSLTKAKKKKIMMWEEMEAEERKEKWNEQSKKGGKKMTGIEEKNRLSEVVNSAGSLLSPRKYFQPYIKKQNIYRTQRQQLLHTLSAILIHTPRGD